MGIVDPFPNGDRCQGKIRIIEHQELDVHKRPVPGAPTAVRHGRARQSSGTGSCGNVEGSVGTEPAGSVFGDNSVYRETWGKRRGGRQVAKRNVKIQVRDLVRVLGIGAPMPHGVSVSGKNSFSRSPGGKWAQ